ncbi:hypothetical protein [Kocuria marina]|uniref:hypothetical protein n=1 Tax=Kocuria marina TaxID=223184 RepID=UPI0011A0D9BF|nr:hypothetical protein [Kocuria indica]
MNASPNQGPKDPAENSRPEGNDKPAKDENSRTTDPKENAQRVTQSVKAKVTRAASTPETEDSPQDVAQENSQLSVTEDRREEAESARPRSSSRTRSTVPNGCAN